MQTPNPQQKTFPSSLSVINSVINEIVHQSKQQAIQKKILSRLMNPFTSEKVNSTINQIGNLIYEEAQDTHPDKKFPHFKEISSPKYMQKDNLFTNGVDVEVFVDQTSFVEESSRLNRNDRLSVHSFKTNISKMPIHVSSMDNLETQNQPVNNKMTIPSKRRHETLETQSQLISLEPQPSNQNRASAFSKSQDAQQRLLEVQINEFRQQKIIQEENLKKTIEKQKKLTHMLSNDEVIMTFDYEGDFIKKTKRELAMMINSQDNRKIVESTLLIKDSEKFWKSKNNRNTLQLRDTTSSFTMNTSNINQLKNNSLKHRDHAVKRTTMQKIQELKKKSILVQLKKKITDSETKVSEKKNNHHFNTFVAVGSNGQHLSEEEQVKIKQNHFEFLSKNLNNYHQKEENFMPEWIQKVQRGCKMTIFVGDGENGKIREKQKQMQKKSHRSFSERSSKTQRVNDSQEKQILGTKKGKKNGGIGKLSEVKHLENLKIGQMSEGEIIEEWQRRVHIKSLDNRPKQPKERKRSSNLKNSRTLSMLESKDITRKNTEVNGNLQGKSQSRVKISKDVEILNEKSQSKNLKQVRYDTIQDDDAKSQISISGMQNQPKTKLNLNRKQFEKLKKYLKNKNAIVTRNDTIKKDSMQFFLGSQKKQAKVNDVAKTTEEPKHTIPILNQTANIETHVEPKFQESTQPINEEEEQSTINENRLSEKHRRLLTLAWKPRSFSVNDRKASPCKSEKDQSKINAKIQGSIVVNSEKLKSSLLKDTIDFDLSKSSILNPHNRSKSRLKTTSSEIKWELTEKSKLKSIRQSQKRLLSTDSRPSSSKIVEIPENINFNEPHLSKIVGKQTPKTQSTSIVVSKPKTSLNRANILKNMAK